MVQELQRDFSNSKAAYKVRNTLETLLYFFSNSPRWRIDFSFLFVFFFDGHSSMEHLITNWFRATIFNNIKLL